MAEHPVFTDLEGPGLSSSFVVAASFSFFAHTSLGGFSFSSPSVPFLPWAGRRRWRHLALRGFLEADPSMRRLRPFLTSRSLLPGLFLWLATLRPFCFVGAECACKC